MSEPRVQFVGERNPSLTYTVTSGGVAQDVSAASAKKFRMRSITSATLKVDAAAAFVNTGTDGQLRYDWAALDVDTEGFYLGRFTFTIGGKDQSTPEFLLWFKSTGPLTGALVTMEEVRQSMELREVADEMDDQIQQLIPIVTERVQEEVQRELVPTTGATRVFRSRGRIFDLAPWDLRTVTSATLDPNGQPTVLAQHADYKVSPSTSRWGTYTRLQLSRYLAQFDQTLVKYGYAELQVVGDWGMAAVPQCAKLASFIAIRAWLDRTSRSQAYVDPDLPGAIPGTYALPPASRNALLPLYRKNVV